MENQNPNAGLIKEIRDRIQFLITVEIFFSAFIYTFYKVIGSNEAVSNTNSLFWAIGVGFCIINYLMVGTTNESGRNILRWVRNLISTNIACFHFKKRGEKKTAPDPPDDRIFPILQRGLKHYALGLCSQAKLVKLLDEWGLRIFRGKKTTPQLVERLLNKYLNFYAGVLVNPWTGEEKEGLHQPMITKEELHQIRLLKLGKSVRSVKHNRSNPLFPLRRTVVCASCGKFLTGSSPRGVGGRYSYYHCANMSCPVYAKSIPKQVLENDFLNYLGRITPREVYLARFKEVVLEVWKEKGRSFALDLQRHEKRLRELELRRKRIFDMREEGSYSKEEFMERKEEVENEIASAKICLSESRIEGLDLESAVKYAENFIRTLDRQWLDLPPHLRGQFQKLVFPEGFPYDKEKGIGTPKLGCIFRLNQSSDSSESHLVEPSPRR